MQLLANIAVLSAIYALVCCGYVLVYRVSRVLNLAHGEVMMVGAYLLLTLALFAADRPVLAIAAAALLSLGFGFVLYFALMKRMTGESVLAAVLVTVALGILLQGLVIGIWTGTDQHPREALGLKNNAIAVLGSAKISAFGMALIATAVSVFAALYGFFRFTRWGIAMRAAGENPLLAAQRGIRLHLVYALAWALAALTGGTAGMLVALDQGLNANLWIIGLKAFPAALVGGLDSLRGAVAGPLIVATAEVMASQYIGSLVAEVAPFVVLILMLMLRPWGLFGSKEELERV